MAQSLPLLVSTEWLDDTRSDHNLVILDASFHLPNSGRDAAREFEQARIPGARFFDIETIKDPASDLPHMMPDDVTFERAMEAIGVSDSSRVIVYDAFGLFSAARAWWMLRAFGHTQVAILDGGFRKWQAEGRMVEVAPPDAPPRGKFTAQLNRKFVKKLDDVWEASRRRDWQILDARSAGRFAGSDPEPRPGLRAGHIPNSLNIPHSALSNPDGTVKSPAELRALFEGAGVNLAGPILTTCGSGVSACNLTFALHMLGHRDAPVYDGSWSEWGARPDTPKAP